VVGGSLVDVGLEVVVVVVGKMVTVGYGSVGSVKVTVYE
jgi:hypothetical protein